MKSNRAKTLRAQFALLVGLFLFPVASFAAGNSDIMNSVEQKLHTGIFGWAGQIQTATESLFFALAGVEVAILFMNHVLQKRGHEDLFTGIIKKTITLGFFLWLINNAVGGIGFMPAVINGLEGGASAVGAPPATPSTIADYALTTGLEIIFSPAVANTNKPSDVTELRTDAQNNDVSGMVSVFSSAISTDTSSNGARGSTDLLPVNFGTLIMTGIETAIMLIPAVIAGGGIFLLAMDFLMVTLESYLVMVLGMVVLAGGGLRYTSKYVGSYMDYGISVGVRLFVIAAITFLTVSVIIPKALIPTLQIGDFYQMAFEAMMVGVIIAILPKKATSIAQTLLTGQSSFGSEGGKALAAGAGAAAVVATGGAALAAGGAAMGMSAVAKAAMAGGAGSLSGAAGGGAGGAGGGAGGGGAGSLSGAAGGGGGNPADGVPFPGFPKQTAQAAKPSDGVPLPKGDTTGDSAPSAALAGGEAQSSTENTPARGESLASDAAVAGGEAVAGSAASAGSGSAPSTTTGGATPAPAKQGPAAQGGATASPSAGQSPATAAASGSPAALAGGKAPAGSDGASSGASPSMSQAAGPSAATGGGSGGSGGSGGDSASDASPSTESAVPGQAAGPSQAAGSDTGPEESAAPAEAPAPLPPVSDAHGVPAPALHPDIQKSLDQIAKNTAPKKSGNVITKTEDSIKKYQDRANAIMEEAKPVKGQGISIEHMRDFD